MIKAPSCAKITPVKHLWRVAKREMTLWVIAREPSLETSFIDEVPWAGRACQGAPYRCKVDK